MFDLVATLNLSNLTAAQLASFIEAVIAAVPGAELANASLAVTPAKAASVTPANG